MLLVSVWFNDVRAIAMDLSQTSALAKAGADGAGISMDIHLGRRTVIMAA